MNIVGLGQCGCNIAEKFNQYPQYEVYLFDSEKRSGKNARVLKEHNTHKDYEENFPKYKYARSGMLKDVVLISNEILEETIPNLTFLNKYDKINEVISYSLHTINVFENTKPVSKTKIDHKDHCRILSLGSYDYKINEENMYFSLDNVIESVYYISIPQKTLEEDFELVKLIKDNFKEKNSSSYQVYSNNADYDYGIVVKRTHFHQARNWKE